MKLIKNSITFSLLVTIIVFLGIILINGASAEVIFSKYYYFLPSIIALLGAGMLATGFGELQQNKHEFLGYVIIFTAILVLVTAIFGFFSF